MPLRIGVNPIGWSNDDLPSLGGETPLETCLEEVADVGFSGVELYHKLPRTPDALQAALEPYELACVSGWHSGRLLERSVEEELLDLEQHLTLLRAMRCEVLVFADLSRGIHGNRSRPLSKRPVLEDADWAFFGERLTEVARVVKTRGLTLAVHHHMGTFVQSAADIDALLASTGPEVRLLVDTGHLAFAGADPGAVIERHGERIAHVHAKDVRLDVVAEVQNADKSFLDAVVDGVFCVPGDGIVDFAKVARALKGVGYEDGWVVLEAEQDPAKAPPREHAERGYGHLVRTLADADLPLTLRGD